MHSPSSATSRNLPVFVFPQSITFYLDDQSTRKQTLTLYNPYDFPVIFKVFCTAPSKYVVYNPEGRIGAKCCVEIIIRHTDLASINCTVDKFRIQMLEYSTKECIGKKVVEAKVMNSTPESPDRETPDPELFQQIPNTERSQQSYSIVSNNKTVQRQETNFVALLAGIICIIGLFLPFVGEPNNQIPDFLHLSMNVKLVLSFVLGMVTIIVLRL